MDGTTQALLLALLGAVLGAGVVLAWQVSENQLRRGEPVEEPVVPAGIATVLSVLRSSALVVDEKDEVLKASAPAYSFGLVRGKEVAVQELADLIRQVRRDGQIRETELVVPRGRAVAPLHVPGRNVVGERVAEDVIRSLRSRYGPPGATYDDREFGFVVHLH